MAKAKHHSPQYDPKRKGEVQTFEVDHACTLVDLLLSILSSCKGAKVRAGMGTNAAGFGFIGVFNTRGTPIASIVTKWDGQG